MFICTMLPGIAVYGQAATIQVWISGDATVTTSDSLTLTAVRVKGRMWRATPLDPKRGRRLDRQKIWSVSSPALMPDCEPRANIDNNEQSERLDNEHSEDDAGDCDAIHDGSFRSSIRLGNRCRISVQRRPGLPPCRDQRVAITVVWGFVGTFVWPNSD